MTFRSHGDQCPHAGHSFQEILSGRRHWESILHSGWRQANCSWRRGVQGVHAVRVHTNSQILNLRLNEADLADPSGLPTVASPF